MIRKALICFCLLTAAEARSQTLNAAGATFPWPIYQRWFQEFRSQHPGAEVSYQAVGSGMGISQLIAGVVDFAGSDMPMTEQQMAQLKTPVLHFPTVLGGVVPIYNLPGHDEEIRLTAEILAGMYLGRITNWDDPRIAAVNPGVRLPQLKISPAHRSDSSGTTFVFTDYLSKTSPEWKAGAGSGTTVKWPSGSGEKGSEGIAARVKNQPGAIGYVELAYALANHLNYAQLRNAEGNFVRAELRSVTAAAARAAAQMPDDFRVSITDAPGKDSWPVSTFTWLLIPGQAQDDAHGREMKALLEWLLTKGQKDCAQLGYAPLPPEVVRREMRQLKLIAAH